MIVLLQAGGNWNNGVNAGISYLNSNNEATNSNRNIGSQLELRLLVGASDLNNVLT